MENLFNIPFLISTYGYTGIFTIVFLESGIFFALPGDSLLFTAGLIASTGLISIIKLIPFVFIATFFGSLVGYIIGENIEKLRKYKFWRSVLKDEYIKKASEFFEKYGKWTIVISRFVPIVRTFVPIVAGIAKMNWQNFVKWNLIGSALWATLMPLLGYFLGLVLPESKDYVHYLIYTVIAISLIPILPHFRKKKSVEKSK